MYIAELGKLHSANRDKLRSWGQLLWTFPSATNLTLQDLTTRQEIRRLHAHMLASTTATRI